MASVLVSSHFGFRLEFITPTRRTPSFLVPVLFPYFHLGSKKDSTAYVISDDEVVELVRIEIDREATFVRSDFEQSSIDEELLPRRWWVSPDTFFVELPSFSRIYAFASESGRLFVGKKSWMQSQMKEERAKLDGYPFLDLEVCRFLGDQDLIERAIARATEYLAETSPIMADNWRKMASREGNRK